MEENEIINPNADAQENARVAAVAGTDATTATTNAPEQNAEQSATPEQPETIVAEQAIAPAQQPEQKIATPHDDFDWSIDKRNVSTYKKEEREKYDSVYDNTFVQINDGEIIKGNVVGLTKTDVVVNIGFKSDGLVSLNEFRDLSNLKVGDDVEVMVVEKEDRAGHLHLSRKSARIFRAWERIVEVHKTGRGYYRHSYQQNQRRLIVDVFGNGNILAGKPDRR
jgi:small subunit ribosomal protein S1